MVLTKTATEMMLVTGKSKGLTFIEISFVIIIIGILMGISLPRFRNTFNSLQLDSSSGDLQTFMNYLQQRAVIEAKIIYLNIDKDNRVYWVSFKGSEDRLRTYRIPAGIEIEIVGAEQKKIFFYPDGNIDKVTIKLTNRNNQQVELTTKGVFGGVKMQSQ